MGLKSGLMIGSSAGNNVSTNIWVEHNTFFAKLVKIINDMHMRLSNVFFILKVLIAFPHGSICKCDGGW